jgi:hypothetical protein
METLLGNNSMGIHHGKISMGTLRGTTIWDYCMGWQYGNIVCGNSIGILRGKNQTGDAVIIIISEALHTSTSTLY